MSQSSRAFPELALRLDRFTASTRASLSRALVRALRGHRHDSPSTLNEAVRIGCRELRVAGTDDQALIEFFAALVEEAGRACGADRPSLLSGESRWVPVRSRVLDLVGDALLVPMPKPVHTPMLAMDPVHTPMLAMDHPIGPR